jgi:hypothetical protein
VSEIGLFCCMRCPYDETCRVLPHTLLMRFPGEIAFFWAVMRCSHEFLCLFYPDAIA